MNNPITFEQIPAKIAEIDRKLTQIEVLILKQSEETPEEKWFQLQELAEYIHVPKATIYGWVQQGKIPNRRKGKRLFFSKLEIDNWLREG